jgi:acyl-coenzyme A thioesterase PaaI-like protein
MKVEKRHLAPNGYLHAASVIALADTSAGYGCVASLPAGAEGFTAIELKANFLGTARDGVTASPRPSISAAPRRCGAPRSPTPRARRSCSSAAPR